MEELENFSIDEQLQKDQIFAEQQRLQEDKEADEFAKRIFDKYFPSRCFDDDVKNNVILAIRLGHIETRNLSE